MGAMRFFSDKKLNLTSYILLPLGIHDRGGYNNLTKPYFFFKSFITTEENRWIISYSNEVEK